MSQLVELQAATPRLAEAGIKLYAVSYDELGALEDFAEHHGITYDLLSDAGSHVIREFEILNHHVTDDQVPFHGIPFPGTYLVDTDGVVVAKSFHAAVPQRIGADAMIDAALGEILLRPDEPSAALTGDAGIEFSISYHGGGGVIRSGALRPLVIRVDLPDGLHIYDEPVPEGMVATTFTLVGPLGMRHLPVECPPTEPLRLPGVGELHVWSGRVDFVMPVWATDEIVSLVRDDAPDDVTLEVEVRYQACDDQACRLPRTERLSVAVPVRPHIGPALDSMPGNEATGMDTRRWLGAMVTRGLEAADDQAAAFAYLERTASAVAEGPGGPRPSGETSSTDDRSGDDGASS
ncbi:MAG: redoxin domain-containing protein [Actinomycetota bacterium]